MEQQRAARPGAKKPVPPAPPTPPAPPPPPAANTPAAYAKGALRRLAQAKQEPTPENYARAYAEESGQPLPGAQDTKAQGQAWALLLEKLARGLERGGRQWTSARKKDSLQRVLDSSRGDMQRLLQRLQSLVSAWESDRVADSPELAEAGATAEAAPPAAPEAPQPAREPVREPAPAVEAWRPVTGTLSSTLQTALPAEEPRAAELADELGRLADQLADLGITPDTVAAIDDVCERARRLFAHRHHLIEQLGGLCRELSHGLTELSEDDSWAHGQCEGLEARLSEGISARSVRAVAEMLRETRERHHRVREERNAARDALKSMIQRMLQELGALGTETGRFSESMGRHAEAIERADTIESLAGVVREMVAESRAVQVFVGQTQQRMHDEHAKANELEERVRELESELRRLSDEVSTDALTQVANRRGLALAFEAECARAERDAAAAGGPTLAVALIDIDNFKRLNDNLGHAAGDVALKSLAAAVRDRLRPTDHLARFGGEEFVVLLPQTPAEEAKQTLTRLQRALTASLFMHDDKEVFVTFSAGVTAWRAGEALDVALERADEALYEAKRSGKNRTCVA